MVTGSGVDEVSGKEGMQVETVRSYKYVDGNNKERCGNLMTLPPIS